MTYKTINEKTISDLRRETAQDVEKIIGKSKTLGRVLKIRHSFSSLVADRSCLRKEKQRD